MVTPDISRRDVLKGLGGGLAAPAVMGHASASAGDEVLVGVDGRDPARRVAEQAQEHLKTINLGHVRQVVLGRFSEEALDGFRRNRHVRYVEPNLAKYHATAQTLPWGIDRVDADVVHASGETGNGADIAIIDTGIDDDHEDLQANVGAGKAYVDCSGSNCNHTWSDDNDHGTHCAGIADAVDNSTGVVGVSTTATLHAVKVLDGSGSGTLSDVASGIKYVADQGWDVGSLSLGASSGDQALKDACQYASDNGVLLVAAAGNQGPCSDCVGYPAAYSTVIAVSSTDEDDSLSSFSSTGPEVELAAPGGDIYSTVIGGYDTLSGTSMACPHVSGAGGQLMANGFTNTEARDRLVTTAEDIGLGDNEQGAGLLDAETAILAGFLVSTTDPTNVDSSSATLNGALEDLDGAASADVYFEWRDVGSSTWNTTSVQTLSSTGSFSAEVTGLTTGTEYEFRTVGQASDGDTDTGATLNFIASDCVDATLWPSGTGDSGYEYITTMDVDGQVVETSSSNAYYDFTCPDVVTVQPGGSFDVAMDFEDDGYTSHYGNVYVDWDQNGDWSTATETQIMENVDDDTVTYTATVNVPSDAATGGTLARMRLSWGSFFGPTATDEYGEVEDFTVFVENTEDAPAVDSLSMSETETGNGDAEFDVDWAVSDTDGNLASVDLALTQDSDGSTEDTTTISVSGSTASGTTRLVAAGDENTGNSYTVEATVTDSGGKTDSATASASESESAPAVDSLAASEVETSDSDAAFDVDWTVSDADADLDSVDLALTQDSDGTTEDTATISVSGGTASDTMRLVAAGDDGSGNAYTVTLTVTDTDGTKTTSSTGVTESEANTAPTVDSLSASEVETSDSDAEFDVSWQVGDSDGNLSSVDLTLTQDSDGSTEDTASISISGDSASGTTRLVAAGDDGSGNSYTVDLTVTDGGGATATDSTSVSETEDTTGDNAPVIDSYTVTEAGSPNPHAEITADWSVSDTDGDLSTVVVTVTDSSGTEQDSATTAVSGGSASGTDQFKLKHKDGQTFDVTMTVTDANSNSSSTTQTVTE